MTIKEIRLKTGMTIEAFAAAFHFDEDVLVQWETRKRTPRPYLVEMVYELCVYRNYFDTTVEVEEKNTIDTFFISHSDRKVAKLLYRISELTNGDFAAAVSADDFPRCHQLIDTQLMLHRIKPDEAAMLHQYINDISI